ncbi:YheC/YheD family protein [Paenibacillus sp. KQZ6P-2]|uniref:YheC/YheD family protein n=1 Tax=Paenibacillus mangrovi TaxID=2931978 RepID=A0A9X1WQG2_9BACL|nr:YheC/YheD family protein [Paenibacillus mangrovi]MCJ8013507.1 YheC/YheD family protein [Paenibacillus mangrovi]
MSYTSTSIRSKWTKNNWLIKHQDLRKHVPSTMLFNKMNLTSMLSDYSIVYFKPTDGSGGFNIVRISKKSQGYETQYKTVTSFHKTMNDLYNYLHRFSNKRSFLLQKGITLARTNGKPFDIRVMVQKTNNGEWVSTAVCTKIGDSRKVATNYNQGGKIDYFHQTMSGAGYNSASIQKIEEKLKQLGVSVGNHFDHYIKGFRELGLDVALDSKGELWILEVNTRPQIYPLKNLQDKELYQRIIYYAKQYGRFT